MRSTPWQHRQGGYEDEGGGQVDIQRDSLVGLE